jgi:uncharacterized sulfatase
MLSGRYPESTGVFENRTNPREKLPNAVFLPEYFKQHGYFTAAIGKISHGHKEQILRCHVVEDLRDGSGRSADLRRGVPFSWAASNNTDAEETDGMIARRAIELLEDQGDDPFFIAVGFHKPHTSHVAPKNYFEMYKPSEMKLNDQRAADGVPSIGRNRFYPDLTESQKRAILLHYSAVTTFMDAQLGLVLDALDRLDKTKNTIVVFWSDHGWHLGDHGGMWAKGTLMEEAVRIPLVIAVPDKAVGVSQQVVETIDLYPTLTDLCGLPQSPEVQGRSFAALIDNPDSPLNHTAYAVKHRRSMVGHSIRDERYMYVEYSDGSIQLYDLAKDPHELENLAGDPVHSKAEFRMQRLLHRTMNLAQK